MEPKNQNSKTYKPLPITGISLIHWIKLILRNGGIDLKYLPKALYVSAQSIKNTPLIVKERVEFDKEVEKVQIQDSPVFIIGHCRSGTSYLHHLIGQDPNWGYITKAQVLVGGSEVFLGSAQKVENWASRVYPTPRKTDSLVLHADDPAEEEIALVNSSLSSFYEGFYFPKKIKSIFQKCVLFQGDESEKIAWKNDYKRMLSRIHLSVGGKRLLIKNPLNGGRIKLLLDLFPDAKFIHIFRNPYDVYASTVKLYQIIVPEWTFQTIDEAEMKENLLFFYQELMNRYFLDKNLIPPENLVEIKYENFIGNEIETLSQIYQQFNLPGFAEAKPRFAHFIEEETKRHKEYKERDNRSKKKLDQETMVKLEKAWKPIIDKWNQM